MTNLHALTLTGGEYQTHNYYVNIAVGKFALARDCNVQTRNSPHGEW